MIEEEFKVGDVVYSEVFSFFDIREITITKVTNYFYCFQIDGKTIRRKKNRFALTKPALLQQKLKVLDFHLQLLKTTSTEIYENIKYIDETYPEIIALG